MSQDEKRLKYLKAKDRVKKIRGFYGHAAIFVLVLFTGILAPLFELSYCMFCFSSDKWLNLLGFTPWFLGLTFHGLLAFGKLNFIKKWEEKKLKEFLEDPQEFN